MVSHLGRRENKPAYNRYRPQNRQTLGFSLSPSNLDFLERIKLALAAAWTDFARLFPRGAAGQIATPKGPCAALRGPRSVDGAFSRFGVQKNTVPVGVLYQTLLHAHLPDELMLKVVHRHLHLDCYRSDLRFVHPNEARITTTAVAATGAFEGESVSIPRSFPQFFSLNEKLALFRALHRQPHRFLRWWSHDRRLSARCPDTVQATKGDDLFARC
jgi:hypothetical protein